MRFCLTKKVADAMGIKAASPQENVPPVFCWSVNVVLVNRRKIYVAVNHASKMAVAVGGVRANELEKLGFYLVQEMAVSLIMLGVNKEAVLQYLDHQNDGMGYEYVKLSDSKDVAALVTACSHVKQGENFIDTAGKPQFLLESLVNFLDAKYIGNNLYMPVIEMMDCLREVCTSKVFLQKVYDITISLDLDKYVAERRLLVPGSMTFEQMHRIIQTAFSWGGCHLFCFEIGSGKKKRHILMNEADTDYLPEGEQYALAEETALDDMLSGVKKLDYIYDFGDNWVHNIKINNVLTEYDANYAQCTGGTGDAPPEDVGGVSGFCRYYDAVSDPQSPEHKDMKSWARSQYWHHPFDIDMINRLLKNIYLGAINFEADLE